MKNFKQRFSKITLKRTTPETSCKINILISYTPRIPYTFRIKANGTKIVICIKTLFNVISLKIYTTFRCHQQVDHG